MCVRQPLPGRSARSMFLTHGEGNGKGRKGEELGGRVGVVREAEEDGLRCWSLKGPGCKSQGYKETRADTHLTRGHM